MSTAANRKQQQQQRPACGRQQIKQNTTTTASQKLYPGRRQSTRMKILSATVACCLFSLLFQSSSQAQEVQQQQQQMTTTTTAATSREENKMTTITIFKIHKEALLNGNNSSTAEDTQQQPQSWLIQKSDLLPATATTFQSSSTGSPLPAATVTPSPVASPQVVTSSSSSVSRTPSVLRPSIEEVASKLSRKHLNLEHDNWRLRQPMFDDTTRASDAQSASSPAATGGVDAEQDIVQVSTDRPNGTVFSSSSSANLLLREGHREHYLHIDRAAAASAINQPKSRQTGGGSSRRKKTFLTGEPFEMSQCHQYLRIYNAPPTTSHQANTGGAPLGFYQMISNQQLPCTCEMRQQETGGEPLSWLSCDHVQLIGGYLHPSSNSSAADTWDMGKVSAATAEGPVQVSRFSQRHSGLQTLHAQKFRNLQLTNLKTIDLSDNRIRQIKVDAFHGLEQTLERLNLANNLLGDSRAITSSSNSNNEQQRQHRSKLIFFTDEFNRLKKLKWLSLRNNRINQLGSTIFTKQQTTISFIQQQDPATGKLHTSISSGINHEEDSSSTKTTTANELVYLDLSENVLKQVPSEAISELNGLQTLNLSKNKLLQLDQSSKFPKSLKYLDLSENLIKIIRNCDLIDLPDLIELNLSHNQLSHLDKTAFLSSVVPPSSLLQPTSNSFLPEHRDQSAQLASGESPLSSLRSSNNLIHDQSQLPALSQATNAKSLLPPTSSESESHLVAAIADTQEKRTRKRRDVVGGVGHEAPEQSSGIVDDIQDLDPLDAEESAPQQRQRQQQTNQRTLPADEDETATTYRLRRREFNSTIRLNLAYNYFTNLPGDSLLKFSNLQHLDISYNRIRYLDSNYLCSIYNLVESLRELDLSGNLLTLPQTNNNNSSASPPTGEGASPAGSRQLNRLFGCLQKLERLSLATNRPLSSSPDSKLRQDESLSVAATHLDDELDDLDALPSSRSSETSADSRLHIKFGDNHGSRHLQQLDLSDNQLRTMPLIEQVFQQPAQLTGRNSTTDQQQQQLNQWMASRVYLVSLNVSYNYIDRLEERDFDHLFSLRYLSFDFNRLASLPTKLMRKFTSLDRASFEGNRLSSLEPLNELFERSIRTLRYLNLANNHLTVWPAISERPTALRQPSEDNRQAPGLQFVLEELNLEGNLFTSSNVSSLFDQFSYMKSLRILNLSQNLLNRVRSDWFKFANENLRTLLLTGNKINSIDLGSFAYNQLNELQQLDLAHNLLKELKRKTFDSLPKLRELDLSHNFLHTINSETFNQMSSMQVLNLSNNKLTSWKCEYFSNLCNSISGNINADLDALLSVVALSPNQLLESDRQQVSALVELDLSHNSLSQLRVNSISVHTKLERLNLAHNKLSYIPHDLFKANILDSKTTTGKQIQLVSSLKYLNLAHNRIQTVDNINLRPLRNLIHFDLSHNELQTLGLDVILIENNSQLQRDQRNTIVSNNVTNLLDNPQQLSARQSRTIHQQQQAGGSNGLPALGKLRQLNLSHNQLTQVNQSLLHELSPFVLLNLNLSHNYLESESLPYGFYAKISSSQPQAKSTPEVQQNNKVYDLVFTLKFESLDLSHNRLNEFPVDLLENHHISMESCNLAHNRIQSLAPNSNILIQIKSLNLEFNPLNRESNELLLFEHKSVRHLNLAATRLYAIKEVSNNLATDTKQLLAGSTAHKHRLLVANQTSQLDLIRSISKPIDAPYVQYLNLSSNQLVWLAANIFEQMHSLETLDLSNNQLTRLHLLTNQLAPLSASLENLNLASNLFTSVDATDFGQLARLRRLDLSSLLSLQKLNCRFLSKLTTLKSLRLFNFPQVRQNLNNILANLQQRQQQQQQDSHGQTDRIVRKLQQELLMSTLGRHCFRDDSAPPFAHQDSDFGDRNLRWLNLEELELELFNAFDGELSMSIAVSGKLSGAFQLEDELGQFLGPQMDRLHLFGLNLTNLGDDSLLGITSPQLDLKISYTSMTRLPLEQVLSGISKRTKLNLDFRNNNIQSLDVRTLQALDELQLNNQILKKGDHSSLRLGSNPMRCDCQTRPLWLWLNQRWAAGNSDQSVRDSSTDDATTAEMQTGSANYWLKFSSSLSQTSDIRCHYPAKLRGKLAQHVNYQELVCKGSSGPPAQNRQARKRNDTLRDYYSKEMADIYAIDGETTDSETDYLDASSEEAASVRVTKFNRFPSMLFNQTINYLQNIPVPFILDNNSARSPTEEFELVDSSSGGRMGKRDGNSVPIYPILNQADLLLQQHNQQPPLNTRHYSRHRPNTQQRHSSFDTLTSLKQFQPAHHHSNNNQRQTILTESDVYILTVMSIAMSIMSFVIIAVCLFKYKMDRSDKERILTDHGKMLMSQALFDIHQHQQQSFRAKQKSTSSGNNSAPSSSSSSSSSAAAKKTTTPPSSGNNSSGSSRQLNNKQHKNAAIPAGAIKQIHMPIMVHQRAPNRSQPLHRAPNDQQVLVQLRDATQTVVKVPAAAAAQNFLMRSPTIRRMQGLATNASDWFKYTLRAYPANAAMHRGQRRRRLFLGDTVPVASQLTTGKRGIEEQLASNEPGSPATLAVGCPQHAFKAVDKLRDNGDSGQASNGVIEEKCLHCARLLATIQQTKVQYLIGKSNQQQQQDKVSATKDQKRDEFVPPSLIRALAQQLDQANAQSNYVALGPEWLKQHQKQQQQQQPQGNELETSSSFYKRGVRSMRTFGMAATGSEAASNNRRATGEDNSQIPSCDVIGRFAYQSDSQVDTPSPYDPANRCSSMLGGGAGSSQMDGSEDTDGHYNTRDGVFILVSDDNSTTNVEQEDTSGGDDDDDNEREPVSVLLNNQAQVRETDQQEESIKMQDECSQSSSPVAYGFMRASGPSSLASSSLINHSQQQHINLYQSSDDNSPSHYHFSTSNNNNNNNNIDNYSVIRKKKTETATAPTAAASEQVIISRL